MSQELALLKKIKLLIGKKLNTLFVGEYHSAFKGHGLEFQNVREYQYGDDIKNIDWNVSARLNHLYIKEYIEERELSIVLMIDLSNSLTFGSQKTKKNVMMEVVTLLLYLAQMNNDRVSVLLFSEIAEKYLIPQKGRKFILKVLDEILKYQPQKKGTSLYEGVSFLQKVLKKRSVIFILSDFLDKKENFLLKLRLLSKKHDLIPIQISDPLEKKTSFFGLTEFLDLETGKTFLSDSLPEKGAFPFLQEFNTIYLNTDEPIDKPLLKFFEKRNKTKIV